MKRKGQTGAAFLILVSLILMALVYGIISLVLGTQVKTMVNDITDGTGINDTNSINVVNETEAQVVPITDNFAFWFMGACLLGLLLLGLYTEWHPALIIIGLVFLIIFIYMAAQYSNIYDDVKSSEDLTESGNHTLSNILFGRHFPVVIGVIGAVVLAFIFSKKGGSPF